MPIDSVFMFSKNMVPIIFIPYIYSFMDKNHVKKFDLLSLVDYLVLLFLILIFFLTLSVSNTIFSIAILFALISPKNIGIRDLWKEKISFKIKTLMKYLGFLSFLIIPIRYLFSINISSEFIVDGELLSRIPALLKPFFNGVKESNPRLDFLIDYFSFDNIYELIFGKHIKIFEYLDFASDSYVAVMNPHNTLIILHNTCGVFGLSIFFIMLIASLKILINNSVSAGIFFLAILLRSTTDSILLATGISAFVIYVSLFSSKKLSNI